MVIMKRTIAGTLMLSAAVAMGGCQIIFGLKSHVDDLGGGAGGTGGTTNTGGSGMVCMPGAVEECDYSGPPETKDVGPCKAPVRTCNEEGTAWSECVGEVKPQTEGCSKVGDEDCNFGGVGCSEAVWSKIFGEANVQTPYQVAVDADRNIFVFGSFDGTISFGGPALTAENPTDIFLVKLDVNGNHVWSKRFKSDSPQVDNAIVVDAAGDVLIAGDFYGELDFGNGPFATKGGSDIFVAKFGPAGNLLWTRQFGDSTNQYLGGIAVDALGDVAIVGTFEGAIHFDNQLSITSLGSVVGEPTDAFVAKLASGSGFGVWAKRFGDDMAAQGANSVAIGGAGHIAVAGAFSGTINFGADNLSTPNESAIYLARFDKDGGLDWAQSFDTYPGIYDLRTDSAGSIVLALMQDGGSSVDLGKGPLAPLGGGFDIVIGKFAATGAPQWSIRAGGSDSDIFPRVAMGSEDRTFVALMSYGTVDFGNGPTFSAGGPDVVLAELDAAGAPVWSKRVGDDAPQGPCVTAAGPKGEILLACSVNGTINFGDAPLTTKGGGDVAVAVIAP
jgi:hypothetical protein